jgi:hypothetical protein
MTYKYKNVVLTCIHIVVFAGVLITSTSAIAKNNLSFYVPLQVSACHTPADSIRKQYQSKDLEVIECPSKIKSKSAPSNLLIVSSNEHSWIEFMFRGKLWSTEDEVVYEKENQFGNFPNVSNAPAEIRINRLGQAMGLVFRVNAQESESKSIALGASKLTRLIVLGFRKSQACFLGIAKENQVARKMVDSGATCKRPLK